MAENQLMMINPFEALETGRKRAYAGYEAGQAAAQREALNELYAQAADPTTGRIDRNRLMSGLAQRRMGSMIPELELEEAKLLEQRGKATQEETKGLEGRMEYWRRLIPADARLAPAWVEAAYADPIVGGHLSQLGSKEEVIAGIPRDPEGYTQWAEGASMFADELSKRRTVTAENLLPYNQPMSPEVLEQQLALRARGAPRTEIKNLTPPAETEFSRTIGRQAGERLQAREQSAQSAARLIASSERLSPLLNSKDFISGTFADARLSVARALGIDVSETESYFSGIGEQVAERIKAFGAGTGLSDKDREFAERIAGGERVTTVEGIRRIMRINNQSAAAVIKSYNDELDFLSKDRPEVRTLYRPVQLEKRVLRYGTLNNRRVAEYSDGTVAYVD